MKACSECGTTDEELRPYGAAGAAICFECAFKTPEKKARTEEAFRRQLLTVDVFVIAAEPPPSETN